MRAITVYEATDGSRHDTAEAATDRDHWVAVVAEAMAPLGDKLRDNDYLNGHGHIPHDPAVVAGVKRSLIGMSRKFLAWWMDRQEKEHLVDLMTVHPSWFGRMMDGANPPLEWAWSRMACIDAGGREWGQPFYAEHPEAVSFQGPYRPVVEGP